MYEYKEVYTLDFTNVKYYRQIHEIIEKEMDFPSYYGGNWDAFWDCLTDMVGRPIHIEIIGMDVIRDKFDDTADMIIETLQELKHYNHDKYSDDILIEIVDGDTRTVIEQEQL